MFARAGSAFLVGFMLVVGLISSSGAAASPAARSAVAPETPDVRGQLTLTSYLGGSRVVEDDIYSPTLDVHTTYRILLPADYDASARRYPVLYMLHGVAGDSSEWQSIGLLEAADRMVQRGEIDPFLIVLPNGGA
jgi:enterochelin esterase-like enzyme